MILGEDIICQFQWWSSAASEADGDDPHECYYLEGHSGPHKCSYVNCGELHPNSEEI